MEESKKKKKKLTVRGLIRIIAYTCTLIVASAALGISGWMRAERYEDYMNYSYQRAFDTLVSNVDNINTSLQKGIYANSPATLAMMAADVWDLSSQAKAQLGELPVSYIQLDHTAKFISQVGSYAYTLSARAADGKKLTDEDRKNLVKLATTAEQLAAQLQELQAYKEMDTFFEAEPTRVLNKVTEADKNAAPASMADGLSSIEEEFPESPALIYDGPYSEHITKRQPALFTEDSRDITVEEAKKKLSDIFGVDASQFRGGDERQGEFTVYSFTLQRGENVGAIDVTKRGGHIISMTESCVPASQKIKPEEAVAKAEIFLNKAGYKTIKSTYWQISNNIVYINFADMQGKVLIYPDLIQVGISMETGTVCFMQARGWLMNHRARGNLTPALGETEARAQLSPLLGVENVQLVYIPTAGENELFCYEFKCRGDNGRSYLVYINAVTGKEEKLMLLIEDESGTLTI